MSPDTRARLLTELFSDHTAPTLTSYLEKNGFRIAAHASGLTERMLRAATTRFSTRTLEILRSDPFEMIGPVPGFTFDIALALWRRLSPEPIGQRRVAMAAANERMAALKASGSVFLARMALTNAILERIFATRDDVEAAVDTLISHGILISATASGTEILVRADALRTERLVASLITKKYRPSAPVDNSSILQAMCETGMRTPDKNQIAAIQSASSNTVSMITGGPGTGKTAILAAINRLVKQIRPSARVKVISLSARVARAIGEKTGIEADTAHATLGVLPDGGGYVHGPHNPLPLDLLIVEEAFMIGNQLLADLLLAVPSTCSIIFVGDPEQLPPVMEGIPLQAILRTRAIPVVQLQTNHRRTARDIPAAATRVMQGRPLADSPNIRILRTSSHDDALDRIRQEFVAAKSACHTVQILTAIHDGHLGTHAINRAIAAHSHHSVGDLVMQTVNDRSAEFWSGELATIRRIGPNGITLARDDGREIKRSPAQIRDLVHASATTYQQSQGIECDIVILVVSRTHARMLGRNLINVGLTRAKKRCIILDHQNGLTTSLAKHQTESRTTLLPRLLIGENIGGKA